MSGIGGVEDRGKELVEAREAARTSARTGFGTVGPCRIIKSVEKGLHKTKYSL